MRVRTSFLSFLTAILLAAVPVAALAQASLVMVEEKGCIWCARWNEQIGPIYPKTDAGKTAPLRRLDIDKDKPEDLEFARKLHYTPTFVLVVDGQEISRIEGYPGEDFFWGLLEKMLADAALIPPSTGS